MPRGPAYAESMFTGLVQQVGEVLGRSPSEAGERIRIDTRGWAHMPEAGDSICISGCCLTVVERGVGGELAFDAIPETLLRTTLGELEVGDQVNLEHSVTPATLLGGHVVQGHVDGVGEVVSVVTDDGYRVRVQPPAELMEFITPKGSVCLAGVSLTIAALDPAAGWFEVALIPETLARTTLPDLQPGSRVNIEADVMTKTMVHWMKHHMPAVMESAG